MKRTECTCDECREFARMGSVVTNWAVAVLVLIVGVIGVIMSADWVAGLFAQ